MSNSKLLDGKLALVTGANRGIGREIVTVFAAHGADVIVNARKEGSVDDFCAELREKHGVDAEPAYFDVTDLDAVKRAFMEVHKRHKRLDILVNNAGVLRDALIGMVTKEVIDEVIDVNVKGVIFCSQYASRLMARGKSGSIISMSSIIGRVGNEGQSVYGASKAAVIGLTLSLAKELGPQNIRVNAIAPGFIDTDMIKEVPQEKFDQIVSGIKLGRLGTPRDVANVALFLASDLANYVTGEVIGVDGGMLV